MLGKGGLFALMLALACSLVPVEGLGAPEAARAAADQLSLEITKQPRGGTFAQGSTVRLYVQASASGGVLTYEWHRVGAGGNVVVGTSSPICDDDTKPAAGRYTYYVKVTNTAADGGSVAKQSSDVVVDVVAGALATSVQNGSFNHTGSPIGVHFWLESQVVPWKTTHNKAISGVPAKVIEMNWSDTTYGMPQSQRRWCSELAASAPSCLYQEVATLPGKLFSWSLDHAARNAREVMALVVAPALTPAESQKLGYTSGGYPYGENTSTYFNAILNQVASEHHTSAESLAEGEYSTTYQGRPCYVCVIADNKDGLWHTHAGTFTVPEGQGRTVFGFTAASASGNLLSNISFAAGGGINASSDVGYKGDGSLAVSMQKGYSYGLVEERGSAVLPVSNSTFAVAGSAPAAYDGGWIAATSASKLAFGNLTPGKTYRVVGVPTRAAGDVLGLNAKPANVLDEQYYDSFTIKSVSEGSPASMGNVQVQAITGPSKQAAVIVEPTRADVDYALLACPGGTAASADAANPAAPWTQGTGAQLRFDGLERGACYLVVARPHGYFEVGYGDARKSGVLVATPGAGFKDVDAADVRRLAASASSIAVEGTSPDQTYCVYDVADGARRTAQRGTGGTITFAGLDAGAVYQVATASASSLYSSGVRSYPAPAPLALDYAGEQAGEGAAGDGAVPTDIEYRMQASNGSWLYGDESTWVAGSGSTAIPLEGALRRMADEACDGATLSYRSKGGANEDSVSVELQTAVAARPPFDGSSGAVSYVRETIDASSHGPGVDASADGWKSYRSLAAGSSLPLSELGWNGGAKTISLRAHATSSSFASTSSEARLPARPGAPTSADVSLSKGAGDAVSILNGSSSALEYRAQGSGDAAPWARIESGASATGVVLPASEAFDVRFAAVQGASFASRSFSLSASTALLDVDLDTVDLVYGYDPSDCTAMLSVHNGGTEDAHVTGISVTGDIECAGPSSGVDVAPGATDGSTWRISAKTGLAADVYDASVVVSYKGGPTDTTTYRAVHEFSFTVAKADQEPPTDVSVATISDTSAMLEASLPAGSPPGAALEYSVDGRTWQDQPTFSDLAPAADYAFSARVKESGNYYASPCATVAARTAHGMPDASALTINYIDETLVYAASTLEASTADVASPSPDELLASGSSVGAFAGETLYLRVKEVPGADGSPSTPASPWRAVALPGRPAAPSAAATPATSSSVSDGAIRVSGAAEFEFRPAAEGSSWASVPTTSIGKRAAGVYDVRIPATATSFASASCQVTVGVQHACVDFDADGGLPAPAAQEVCIAQPDGTPITAYAAKPADVGKPGFRFTGWFAAGSPTAWDFSSDPVVSDLKLTAHWEGNTHPVTYYLNDGAAAEPYHVDAAVPFETKLVAPEDPHRGGYAFGGWWASSDGGATLDAQWDFDNATMPDADMGLYAKWTPVFEASVPLSVTGSVSAASGLATLPSEHECRIVNKTPVPVRVESVEFAFAAEEGADPLIATGRSQVSFSVNGMGVAGPKAGEAVAPGAGEAARFAVPAAAWSGDACAEGTLGLELSMALNGATLSAAHSSSPFATLCFTLAMDGDGR